MKPGYQARHAVVVTPDHVAIDGVQTPQLPEHRGLNYDLAYCLDKCADRFAYDGVLLLSGISSAELNDKPAAAALAAGWTRTGGADGSPRVWSSWRKGEQWVRVGVLDEMTADATPLLLASERKGEPDLISDPSEISRRFDAFHASFGVPFAMRPGVTVGMMVRRFYDDKKPWRGKKPPQPTWVWKNPIAPAKEQGNWNWKAQRPNAGRGTVALDTRAAFLRAMISCAFAWGKPMMTGPILFDARRSGWWRIKMPDWPVDWPTLVNPRRVMPNGNVWISTPIAQALEDLGMLPPILDSLTSRGRAVLAGVGERIRSVELGMSGRGHELPRAARKSLWGECAGQMARKSSFGVNRPDWAATMVDFCRARTFMAAMTIYTRRRVWPDEIHTDELVYRTSLDAATLAGDLLGPAIGQLKVSREEGL